MGTTQFEADELGVGSFDGQSFQFHSFPTPKLGSGEIDGVSFYQTMGRMIINFELGRSLQKEDIEVKLSCLSLQVSAEGREVKELRKDFHAEVVPHLCWWEVEDSEASRSLILFLAKAQHHTWARPFSSRLFDDRNFGWRRPWKRPEDPTEKELMEFQIMPHLDWEARSKHLSLGLWPKDFFRKLDSAEDDESILVTIHLDSEALNSLDGRIPPEELFRAKVTADSLTVTLGADAVPLCSLKLKGQCVPELSAWALAWRDPLTRRTRTEASRHSLPELSFGLVKAKCSMGLWKDIFEDCFTPLRRSGHGELDLASEAELEMLLELLTGDTHPVTKREKAHFAKKLVTGIEAIEDGEKIQLKLQLEETFLDRCEHLQVNPYQVFTATASDRFIYVGFRADGIYEVCLLGLGGRCKSEATSFAFDVVDCNLRISTEKAMDSETWEPIYSCVEPWQARSECFAVTKTKENIFFKERPSLEALKA